MTWHLKDRELEKKLNDLVGENLFTESLNKACIAIESLKTVVVKFGENTGHVKGSFRCYFNKTELFNIGYEPHQWNNYPEVTPPEGVLMRVEIDANGILRRNCAIFTGVDWHITADGSAVYADGFTLDNVKRFRPWED